MSKSSSRSSLQDQLLNYVRKNKIRTSLFLVNGVKLQGVIASFDSFCILLSDGDRKQLIYKSAVSTVSPNDPIDLTPENIEE